MDAHGTGASTSTRPVSWRRAMRVAVSNLLTLATTIGESGWLRHRRESCRMRGENDASVADHGHGRRGVADSQRIECGVRGGQRQVRQRFHCGVLVVVVRSTWSGSSWSRSRWSKSWWMVEVEAAGVEVVRCPQVVVSVVGDSSLADEVTSEQARGAVRPQRCCPRTATRMGPASTEATVPGVGLQSQDSTWTDNAEDERGAALRSSLHRSSP